MRYKFLTGLTLLAVSALCLSLKAQSRRDFSYTLQLDSLAELRFAEGDMRGSICLWLEAAGIADHCAKTEEDSLIYSGFLQSLGVCYRRISMMDSTLHYYNMAWKIIQDKTSPAAVSEKTRLLTSMAILMTFMGRDEESVQFADRAMVMAGEATDIEMVMYAATNAGGIYARNGDFTKSASALRMAVSKTKENGMTDRLLSALTIMTSMFSLAGEKDSVSHYLAMAEEVAAELPENSVAVLGFRETQASVLGSLGRYAESNAIYRRLLSASGSNSSVAEDAGYIAMARNYMAMGQWENAGQCYERAYSVLDSIYSEDITSQVSEWSAKYGAAEKELEISRLEQESLKKQAAIKTWVIIAMALVAVLTGVVLTAAFRRKHLKKVEELRLARKYIDGVEKERARVARDLHDGICNDLLGIGMQISAMRPCSPEQDKVLSMLEGLRSEVRTISHDMMPPQFSFSGIEEVIEMYADSDAERIDAELRLSDSSLTLTVSDYGKHSGPDMPDKGGVGLKVMSERARSIEAVISYHSADGANIFKLNVPLTDL